MLGHDLRNPLASIFAGMRLIQKSKLDEKAEAIVIMMQKSFMRMASLIDNVLDFARGRLGGGITLTLSAQPLQPTLQQVVDELQSTHPESIIKTEFALTKPVNCRSGADRAAFLESAGQRVDARCRTGEPVTVTAKTEDEFELAVCNAAIQSRLKRWSGCSTHSRAARCDQASRDWDLASTLRPRSPRRTAARLR